MLATATSMIALVLSYAGAREIRHFDDLTSDLPHEPITAVAVDPTDDATLFAGLDGFLFKSTDGGETWRPVLSFPRGIAIDADDDTGVRQLDDGRGDDGGTAGRSAADPLALDEAERFEEREERIEADDAAFEAQTLAGLEGDELPEGDVVDGADLVSFPREGPGVRTIAFVPGSPTVMWVATPQGLYRSTTSGDSWQRIVIPGAQRENDIRDVVIDPARPSRLYIATADGLKISRDGGATVRAASGRVGDIPSISAAVGRGSEGVVVLVGSEQGLFRSIDGGDTFLEVLLRALPLRTSIGAVAFQEDGETTYAGTSRGLWVGERSAALLERYGGIPPQIVQAISPGKARRSIAVGTRDVGVLFSSDAGLTVDEREQVPASDVLSLARGRDDNAILVGTDRGIFRSVKGSGVTVQASAIKRLRDVWSKEPTLERATAQALSAAGIDLVEVGSMAARAAVAPLMPRMQVRYDVIAGRVERTREFVLVVGELPPGLDPDRDEIDVFGNVGFLVLEPSEGVLHRGLVTLTWDLDRLILNRDEVQVGRNVTAWWGRERSVVNKVQELYAARRRLMTEIVIGPAPGGKRALEKEITRQLRLDELTAELDAITAGHFSTYVETEGRE